MTSIQATGPSRSQLLLGRTVAEADADAQAADDPLRPTAADGWSPDRISVVHSRNTGGFLGSAVNFTLGGIDEQPGQRLSQGQVDRLAPFFASQFGLDEGYVRGELAKVYLYVGGPSTTAQQAMTIGHHVYVPDERSLRHIMEPSGRGWLTHELAHTMQFLAYEGGSPHAFLADYVNSIVVGQDPQRPGSGDGPAVWGALFTGLRSAGHPEEDLGKAATTFRDRLVSSVLPASALALPVALVGSGLLATSRATTGVPLLGTGRSLPLAMSGIAAPAIAGSLIGSFSDRMGDGWTKTLGAVAGGGLAAGALWKAGAFSATLAKPGMHQVVGKMGRGGALALAAGATLSGAAIGLLSATASANTIRGWSNSAQVLTALRNKPAGEAPKDLSFKDALHDSHWIEIDAESVARRFVHGQWDKPEAGDPPITGRIPTAATGFDRVDADFSARADWGLRVPLLVGVPAALGLGTGVLATRSGVTLLRSAVRDGRGPGEAIRESLRVLGSERRGIANSLGIGASMTVAPLVAGGALGPIIYNATGSTLAARIGGGAIGSIVTGALLTTLLRGKGGSATATSVKVAAGAIVGGGLGLLASGVATDALRPQRREYDVAGGTSATTPG